MKVASISSSPEASRPHDLPSPRVGTFSFATASVNCGKNMAYVFLQNKASVKRESQDDTRDPNGPGWCGLARWPHHLVSFGPLGSSRVLLSPIVILPLKNFRGIFP
jgi:hypothetical protein